MTTTDPRTAGGHVVSPGTRAERVAELLQARNRIDHRINLIVQTTPSLPPHLLAELERARAVSRWHDTVMMVSTRRAVLGRTWRRA